MPIVLMGWDTSGASFASSCMFSYTTSMSQRRAISAMASYSQPIAVSVLDELQRRIGVFSVTTVTTCPPKSGDAFRRLQCRPGIRAAKSGRFCGQLRSQMMSRLQTLGFARRACKAFAWQDGAIARTPPA